MGAVTSLLSPLNLTTVAVTLVSPMRECFYLQAEGIPGCPRLPDHVANKILGSEQEPIILEYLTWSNMGVCLRRMPILR